MFPKPDACRGCPFYGDGLGYCPDEYIEGSLVYIKGQGPGKDEESEGRCFTGPTGQKMDERFLPLAGLTRGEDVSIGNTIRCRWTRPDGTKTDDLPPDDILQVAADHCRRAHERIPSSVRLIVAQGQVAWKYSGGPGNIHSWRGYLRPSGAVQPSGEFQEGDDGGHGGEIAGHRDATEVAGVLHGMHREVPVQPTATLATVHLANLRFEHHLTVPTMADWAKIPLFLAGTWPKPFPKVLNIATCSWNQVEKFWYTLDELKGSVRLVIDTEYNKDSKVMWLVGFYYEGAPFVLQMPWLSKEINSWQRSEIIRHLRRVLRFTPALMQNVLADVPVFRRNLDIDWDDYVRIPDDCMQAHAVLYVEYDHDLGFLDSMHGQHDRVKHLFKQDPELYNAGDCWTPIYAMAAFDREFEADPGSRKVYGDHLNLLPIVDESMVRGIRINGDAVREGISLYEGRARAAEKVAQQYCGYPINVSSNDQVAKWLYDIEAMPLQRKKGRRKEADVEGTVGKDAIGTLRSKILEFDPDDIPSEKYLAERIGLGGHPLLESRFVNQAAKQNLNHYLYPLIGKDGVVVERVYHSIAIHTQNNARWSYTRPPLAQVPKDLLYIYEPDVGWDWLIWDWDQIELRQVAAIARDWDLLAQFERGLDVHLIASCDVFNIIRPPVLVNPFHAPENYEWKVHHNWQVCDHARELCGKGDLRRTFGKNFQYRECFSLEANPKAAINMPAARALGLTYEDMLRADTNWKLAHPAIVQWKHKYVAEGKRTRKSRTFHGRLRRFTDHLANLNDQILDHPSQAGTQDIANLTAIAIKSRFKDAVYYVYGRHDSQNWAIRAQFFDEIVPEIKEIVQQKRNIFGLDIPFPASFDVRRATC